MEAAYRRLISCLGALRAMAKRVASAYNGAPGNPSSIKDLGQNNVGYQDI